MELKVKFFVTIKEVDFEVSKEEATALFKQLKEALEPPTKVEHVWIEKPNTTPWPWAPYIAPPAITYINTDSPLPNPHYKFEVDSSSSPKGYVGHFSGITYKKD